MNDIINERYNKNHIRFQVQSERLFSSCFVDYFCNPRLDTSDVIRLTVLCLASEVSSRLSTIISKFSLGYPKGQLGRRNGVTISMSAFLLDIRIYSPWASDNGTIAHKSATCSGALALIRTRQVSPRIQCNAILSNALLTAFAYIIKRCGYMGELVSI